MDLETGRHFLIGTCSVRPEDAAVGHFTIVPVPRFSVSQKVLPFPLAAAAHPPMHYRVRAVHALVPLRDSATPSAQPGSAGRWLMETWQMAVLIEPGGPHPRWLPGWRPANQEA